MATSQIINYIPQKTGSIDTATKLTFEVPQGHIAIVMVHHPYGAVTSGMYMCFGGYSNAQNNVVAIKDSPECTVTKTSTISFEVSTTVGAFVQVYGGK